MKKILNTILNILKFLKPKGVYASYNYHKHQSLILKNKGMFYYNILNQNDKTKFVDKFVDREFNISLFFPAIDLDKIIFAIYNKLYNHKKIIYKRISNKTSYFLFMFIFFIIFTSIFCLSIKNYKKSQMKTFDK